MNRQISVSAPARLHFGLLAFGHHEPEASQFRQYGGIGLMVAEPRVQLVLLPSKEFVVTGLEAERVAVVAKRWMQATSRSPRCEIRVLSTIAPHVGLGSGTQLAHAVLAGLFRFQDSDLPLDAWQLTRIDGRGTRSAVGTHGFFQGGCIAEDGKLSGETLGQLRCRVPVPDDWRFVLLRPSEQQGRFGRDEATAFRDLPAVPQTVSRQLADIMTEQLIPACVSGDFLRFSSAVYEYGIRAGQCFSSCQGGPFASTALQQMVQFIRGLGYAGVGQSSWGPTLFAVTPDQQSADELVVQLNSADAQAACVWDIQVTRADNRGAIVSTGAKDRDVAVGGSFQRPRRLDRREVGS